MRILQLYDGHERVSPEESVPSIVYYLSKSLVRKGHDVTVLERRWENLMSSEIDEGVNFVRMTMRIGSSIPYAEIPYKMLKNPASIIKFVSDRTEFAIRTHVFLKKNAFDVVHVHLPFSACILVNLNGHIKEKIIYTAHVGEEKKRFKLNSGKGTLPLLGGFSPDLYLIRKVRKSIVLNQPIKERLIAMGIEKEKLDVIPNGMELKELNIHKDELDRVRNRYALNKITVMFAGHIVQRKGVHYLVKAAKILHDNMDVLFLIVGNQNINKEFTMQIKEYVRRHGLTNVHLAGFIPYEDLRVLYSACDIFVLPSFEEGDPMALKEALASGKPLIGTKVGGVPIQIKDGWNGFIIEPGNEKQLVEKISYLIDNEEERMRMGKNSRRLAEKEFSWEKIVEKYLNVYEQVAQQ